MALSNACLLDRLSWHMDWHPELNLALERLIFLSSKTPRGYLRVEEVTRFLQSRFDNPDYPPAKHEIVVKFLLSYGGCFLWHNPEPLDNPDLGISLSWSGLVELVDCLWARDLQEKWHDDLGYMRLEGLKPNTFAEKLLAHETYRKKVLYTILEMTRGGPDDLVAIGCLARGLSCAFHWRASDVFSLPNVRALLRHLGGLVVWTDLRYVDSAKVALSQEAIAELVGVNPPELPSMTVYDCHTYFLSRDENLAKFLKLIDGLSLGYGGWLPTTNLRLEAKELFPVWFGSEFAPFVTKLRQMKLVETKMVFRGHPGQSIQRPGTRPRFMALRVTVQGQDLIRRFTE